LLKRTFLQASCPSHHLTNRTYLTDSLDVIRACLINIIKQETMRLG